MFCFTSCSQWLHESLGAEKNDQNTAYKNAPGENIDRFKRSDYATHTCHIYIYLIHYNHTKNRWCLYPIMCCLLCLSREKKKKHVVEHRSSAILGRASIRGKVITSGMQANPAAWMEPLSRRACPLGKSPWLAAWFLKIHGLAMKSMPKLKG